MFTNETTTPVQAVEKDPLFPRLLGFLILAIGIVIGLWVFVSLYQLVTHPEQISIFEHFVTGAASKPVELGSVEIKMPPIVLSVLAYILCIIVLSIAVGLAGVFINGGVNLFSSTRRIEKAILRALLKNKT